MSPELKSFLNKLSSLPNKEKFDKHYWSDYLELKCFIDSEQLITQADFLDLLKERADLSEDGYDDPFLESELSDNFTLPSDKDSIFVSDCFDLIKHRAALYGESYPFNYNTSLKTLTSIFDDSNPSHKLYIFLLLCSTLTYTMPYKSVLTSTFEVLSWQALKSIFPNTNDIHIFGSSNSVNIESKYSGTFWNKINQLASDLKERVMCNERDFSSRNTGDGGLDFIGWISNGDGLPHMITFTGQAACTENWNIKQFSSSYDNWRQKVSFSVTPINFCFTPFCLKTSEGGWHRRTEIGNTVLIDRFRLMHHLEHSVEAPITLEENITKIKEVYQTRQNYLE